MRNPSGQGISTQKELAARARQEEEQAEQEENERNRLPDDAVVDVEAEKKGANSDEILDGLDEELIGLVPVKTRIREITDLLVVDRLRQKFGIESTDPRCTCPSPAARARGRPPSPCAWPRCSTACGTWPRATWSTSPVTIWWASTSANRSQDQRGAQAGMGGVLFIDEAYYLYRQENERDYRRQRGDRQLAALGRMCSAGAQLR